MLAGCGTTAMEVVACGSASAPAPRLPAVRAGPGGNVDALRLWDDNGNGRITCAEARRHGIAPVPRSHPAYPYMRDGDGDGVVCETRFNTRRSIGRPGPPYSANLPQCRRPDRP